MNDRREEIAKERSEVIERNDKKDILRLQDDWDWIRNLKNINGECLEVIQAIQRI